MASRPRIVPRSMASGAPSTPGPLKPSQTPNLSYPFLSDSPGAYLAPKDGAVKLKVKAGVSPEARSRIGAAPGGLRPVTPRPVKRALVPVTPSATPGGGNEVIRRSALGRAMTPSTIDESLSRFEHSRSGGYTEEGLSAMGEDEGMGETEAVMVTVRVRPPNAADMQQISQGSVWETNEWNTQNIKLAKEVQGTRDDREWNFDKILDPYSDNAKAYTTSARTHIKRAMEGYNALIFAYGQTASGKTHTLSGSPSEPGIIPLSIRDLFAQIRSEPEREFLLRASYLELYNEALLDLLSSDGKELSLSEGKKKGEVVVNGLTECAVRTEEDVRRLLKVGEDNRKVGRTDWNARSSRSHVVFRLLQVIESDQLTDKVIESRASYAESAAASSARTPAKPKAGSDRMTRISTLSIIDLAGSERHTSSKERNAEGKHINQSLLTLKIVISKLADMASGRNISHVPYRDSKLTRLLQPSLSGDALISVICTLSPSPVNLNESLSTLSFAQGLKRVLLRAQKREVQDPQALIQQYQEEIAELKAMLRDREGSVSSVNTAGSGAVSGGEAASGKGRGKGEMEKRLEELKSMILSGREAGEKGGVGEARPLSPTKLKYPKLNYDKSTADLQESLHAAELKMSQQSHEISRLRYELEARAVKPDERILALQDEVAGLKLIADDYERHLREPSRKVKEDVEKEWKGRVEKLEEQLQTKHVWAVRLDENVRGVTAENKVLKARCEDAEQKVHLIIDWLNTTLSNPSPTSSPSRPSLSHADQPAFDIPHLVVEAPVDDFAPSSLDNAGGKGRIATLTLSARMTRDKISHMDLASLSERFGSLGVRARAGGVKMLREESCSDLYEQAGDEL